MANNYKLNVPGFIGCLLMLAACRPALQTRSELAAFVHKPGNGLMETQHSGDAEVTAVYLPAALLPGESSNQLQSKDKMIFELSYSANGKELLSQLPVKVYSEMVNVFAFRMQDFVELKAGNGKAVAAAACIFQPSYGLARQNKLMVVFDRNKIEKSDPLILTNKEFGLGLGNMRFEFNRESMEKVDAVGNNMNSKQ